VAQLTFGKHMQGKAFRVEVGFVAPPRVTLAPEEEGQNPPVGALVCGEPLMIETDVLGFAAGTDVEFRICEPNRLHESPVDTLTAQTTDEDRGVSVDWTFNWDDHKGSVHVARFVCIAQVDTLVAISEPFWIYDRFETTLQDGDGAPLAHARVRLRAAGLEDVVAEADDEGKVEVLVPPGDYLLELLDEG